MSEIIKIYLLLMFILLLADCTGAKNQINYNNPKKVALVFCYAIAHHDIERAKLVSTEDTKKVLTVLQTLEDAMQPNQESPNNTQIEEKLKSLKKVKCEIVDNLARCKMCCDEKGETDILMLKKVENKWLVNMAKEELQKK
ncbi:MAG: DUF4878 domain-containing protein [Saprospiraceae bacterium]|nr:DUF4878 domain-containing protein [Saprospiraceae bacterium]